jgi:hypothetical protein
MAQYNDTIPVSLVKGLGRFFYVVDPAETSYEHVEAVPEFYHQVSYERDIGQHAVLRKYINIFGGNNHEIHVTIEVSSRLIF